MRNNKLFSILFVINILFSSQSIFLEQRQETILPYTTYNLQTATTPFWSNTIMYNESLMFVGKNDIAPLLFTPTSIIAVTSYDGKTIYKEGEDFILIGNKIQLTNSSKIPYFTKEEYYPNQLITGETFECANPQYKAIRFSEAGIFQQRQILVTYYHEQSSINIQETYFSRFTNFIKKIQYKEEPTMLFFGDSITVGASASGFLGQQPLQPIWPKIVHEYLQSYFRSTIKYVNTAVGGKASDWGIATINENVLIYNPDFVVIGFGMNDAITKAKFKENINGMIKAIITQNPKVEILLISTTLPNSDVKGFTAFQSTFEGALEELVNNYNNVGLARMTSMHQFLLKTKRFYDMTGNNVNHPNDFLVRVYCQTVLASILKDHK